MNPLAYIQRMKQEWTPDRYLEGKFTNEDETKFCAYGKLRELSRAAAVKYYYSPVSIENVILTSEAYQAARMLGQKLMDLYPDEAEMALDFDPEQDFLVWTNDTENGYEKIMSAIDAVLLEHSAELVSEQPVTEITVDNRELVPA